MLDSTIRIGKKLAPPLTVLIGCAVLFVAACSRSEPSPEDRSSEIMPPKDAQAAAARAEPLPELLYLPDGGDFAPPTPPERMLLPGFVGQAAARGRCPAEMVDVGGQFCIDRYEASLVDKLSGRELSPYYSPSRAELRRTYDYWRRYAAQSATAAGRELPIPEPPAWQLNEGFEPRAIVRAGAVPNGYLSGLMAELACQNAGKRLCRPEEWVQACRGQLGRKFPYGEHYDAGRCNVFREAHPASVLHADASRYHLDPRLNLVKVNGRPLLQSTGMSPDCRSEWGGDSVYDMVGNLDEWVDDPGGSFLGGFYARNSRDGCDARISTHPRQYFDYSLGVRCCL